ncbi:MAG: hypothetical protein JWL61_996 [Gemmatimonadetes bacterium]|nr:hypothetical protein [Gemmatimonadota bacterium]
MRNFTVAIATCSLVVAGALVACSHDEEGTSCFGPLVNGIVAYSPGIDVLVRDVSGRGEALGARVTVYRGTDSMTTTGTDTLHIRAGFMIAGNFMVRVQRPYYQDAVLPSVSVVAGQCNVVVTSAPVTLTLVQGAPAIRSLVVFGADFLYAPAVQRQLSARFDADPSVPTTVNWRLSDTTLARIDPTGLVTSKCSLVGGVDTVTAIATADTTIKAKAVFGVAKVAACT